MDFVKMQIYILFFIHIQYKNITYTHILKYNLRLQHVINKISISNIWSRLCYYTNIKMCPVTAPSTVRLKSTNNLLI